MSYDIDISKLSQWCYTHECDATCPFYIEVVRKRANCLLAMPPESWVVDDVMQRYEVIVDEAQHG